MEVNNTGVCLLVFHHHPSQHRIFDICQITHYDSFAVFLQCQSCDCVDEEVLEPAGAVRIAPGQMLMFLEEGPYHAGQTGWKETP